MADDPAWKTEAVLALFIAFNSQLFRRVTISNIIG